MSAYPTGAQYVLSSDDGRVTAEIAQVGAALRAFSVDGVDLVPRYPLESPAPAASGVVLVPWAGRVRDGRWTQRGQTRELAITDRPTGSASHGLLRFAPYAVVAQDADRVTLAAPVVPQTGYPFHIATTVAYALTGTGLDVTHTLTNVGSDDAPVALGTHPYFCIGDVDTADLVLTSHGTRRFVLDDRKVPVAEEDVDAATDLRGGRRLGDVDLDTGYSGLPRDPDGIARTTLTAPDGRTLTIWQGEGFDYVQVFTTDRYPDHPLAVAVEPMTAPPDALNSGRSLRWLAPGETWELHWGAVFATA